MTKRISKIIIVVMLAIMATSFILTLVVPSHTGEIRQDLEVGDYYIHETTDLKGSILYREMRITGITESGKLYVSIKNSNESLSQTAMTKHEFLSNILFTKTDDSPNIGYASINTNWGSKFCTMYEKNSGVYWVGEHDIIYKTRFFNLDYKLVETSLIIK